MINTDDHADISESEEGTCTCRHPSKLEPACLCPVSVTKKCDNEFCQQSSSTISSTKDSGYFLCRPVATFAHRPAAGACSSAAQRGKFLRSAALVYRCAGPDSSGEVTNDAVLQRGLPHRAN